MRLAALALVVAIAATREAPASARDPRCGEPGSPTPLAPPAIRAGATRESLESAGADAWRRGDTRGAIDAWRAALALDRDRADLAREADTRVRLARGWRSLGEPQRALESLAGALDLPDAWAARVETERSAALRALGREADASAAADRAVVAARQAGEGALLAQALGARAAARRDLEQADADWREAIDAGRAAGAPATSAALRLARARAKSQSGTPTGAAVAREELGAARAELAAVARSAERAQLAVHAARTWRLLAAAEPDPARRTRDRLMAAELLRAALDDSTLLADHRGQAQAEGELGEIYDEEGRGDEAEQLARRALSSAQTSATPESAWRWQRLLGRRQRASGRVDEALAQLRAAARALAAQGAGRASAADPLARDAAAATRLELVDLLLERASFTEDAAARRDLLLEARDALELSKTAELRDYFRDECLASERRVVAEQLPAALVVYPVVLPDRTELLVSRGDAIRSIRVPIGGADLARDAHALRALLEKRTTRQYLPLAQQLYDRLIRPLEGLLAEPGVETLVFVPGGPLRTIPLGALHDREAGRFLIEKIPVAVVPGLSLVEPRPLDRTRARVVQAGLSESVQGYLPLLAVEAELAAVHDAFGGTTLLNREFVTAALEREIESQPYGIVHIASHGEFHGDAAKSFLLTWDGRLALERLADVVSVTRFREQPLELLALSACETAAGDERAALGLAGVAVRAGARSALATLWSIPDESAAEIVAEFYRQLAQPGTSRAQALQRAQVSVLSRVEYRHPGYWAPFLLISSWL